jgi:dTDP-D-glucose 4,6-dehydratase
MGYRPAVSFEDGLRRTVEWYLRRTQKRGARDLDDWVEAESEVTRDAVQK